MGRRLRRIRVMADSVVLQPFAESDEAPFGAGLDGRQIPSSDSTGWHAITPWPCEAASRCARNLSELASYEW